MNKIETILKNNLKNNVVDLKSLLEELIGELLSKETEETIYNYIKGSNKKSVQTKLNA